MVCLKGQIIKFENTYTKLHKNIQRAVFKDQSGQISLIWFNQPYIVRSIKTNSPLYILGKITPWQNQKTVISPQISYTAPPSILPVYPETEGLSSKRFRRFFQNHLQALFDIISLPPELPPPILAKHRLPDLKTALTKAHLPQKIDDIDLAQNRLAINYILNLQIRSHFLKKQQLEIKPTFPLKTSPAINSKITSLIRSLPFKLTSAQNITWRQTRKDLLSKNTTNRLIQGETGSGKTVIALLSAYLVHLNHHPSLLVCPTQVLALQHYRYFKSILPPTVPIHLFTQKKKPKKIFKNSVTIATHSALHHPGLFDRTTLVIFDEQHKFGVNQRNLFTNHHPHLLTMTATPIPRTIKLTLLNHLDVSYLDQLPKNRLKIKTFLVPPHKQIDCFHWVKNLITETKQQAFYVCPFIDESETLLSVKAATSEFHQLKNLFPGLKIGLVHGQTTNKHQVFKQFSQNKINILVTTPIIEVGIDFPNATVIIIQSADRFGLSSLHQLRGRVGRSHLQSYCFLFTQSTDKKIQSRLKYLETHSLGNDISQFDLENRGPGDIFSTKQHGFNNLRLEFLTKPKNIDISQQILADLLSLFPQFNLNDLLIKPILPSTNQITN